MTSIGERFNAGAYRGMQGYESADAKVKNGTANAADHYKSAIWPPNRILNSVVRGIGNVFTNGDLPYGAMDLR
jgi:hypothetical protein